MTNASGLVLDLDFSEQSGSVAGDSSRYGNDGALNGCKWVEHGLRFNGDDDGIDCGSMNITDEIGISVMVRWNDIIYAYIINIMTDDLDIASTKINIAIAGSGAEFVLDFGEIYFFDGNDVIPTGVIITENTWTHIVFTRSGLGANQAHLYINGILSWTGTWNNICGTERVFISSMNGRTNNFLGDIAEVQIYNRALNASKIMAMYDESKHRYK